MQSHMGLERDNEDYMWGLVETLRFRKSRSTTSHTSQMNLELKWVILGPSSILHCKLFARSGNMQNLCHTLSLFHACSLNNYWLLQPKHVCFIILELMPVVVTCMYLLYKFFRFCLYNMHLLVWKTCIQQGKVWHRFSCSLNMPTGLQNGIYIAFFLDLT